MTREQHSLSTTQSANAAKQPLTSNHITSQGIREGGMAWVHVNSHFTMDVMPAFAMAKREREEIQLVCDGKQEQEVPYE